jgi:hypothetical protein
MPRQRSKQENTIVHTYVTEVAKLVHPAVVEDSDGVAQGINHTKMVEAIIALEDQLEAVRTAMGTATATMHRRLASVENAPADGPPTPPAPPKSGGGAGGISEDLVHKMLDTIQQVAK